MVKDKTSNFIYKWDDVKKVRQYNLIIKNI